MAQVSRHTSEHVNVKMFLMMPIPSYTHRILGLNFSLIHRNHHSEHPKSTKSRNSETKYGKQQKNQGSNRSKEREIELINEEV